LIHPRRPESGDFPLENRAEPVDHLNGVAEVVTHHGRHLSDGGHPFVLLQAKLVFFQGIQHGFDVVGKRRNLVVARYCHLARVEGVRIQLADVVAEFGQSRYNVPVHAQHREQSDDDPNYHEGPDEVCCARQAVLVNDPRGFHHENKSRFIENVVYERDARYQVLAQFVDGYRIVIRDLRENDLICGVIDGRLDLVDPHGQGSVLPQLAYLP
jgi:hypothetical protein